MMSARGIDVLEPRHLVALQQRLERADRVDLGHDHPRALARQRGRRALADVAEAADQRDLAADEHVGGPVEAVDERVADAVGVVELALGDRVVDVDRREEQLALLGELVEPVHAGGGLLGDAEDALGDRPATSSGSAASERRSTSRMIRYSSETVRSSASGEGTTPAFSNSTPLWTSSVASPPSSRIMLGPRPSPKSNSFSVAHQYSARVSPFHANTETPCGASGVPCGPTTAAAAAWSCVEKMLHDTQRTSAPRRHERLDEDGGLDGHVQRARDARAVQGPRLGVLAAQLHQAGHLVLGEPDLLAAELVEVDVGDGEIEAADGLQTVGGDGHGWIS